MSTSRNGLVKFLGSDLGGITEPPDGVHDLLEEWRKTSNVDRIQYRLITREPGASTMKRLTPRGLKSGQFLEVRVNPDCGGNDNCWLISLVFDKESASEIERRLRAGVEAVNNRRPERHTPTPASPVEPLPDPYAAATIADLRADRAVRSQEIFQVEKYRVQRLELADRLAVDIATMDSKIADLESELKKASSTRAELEQRRSEASKSANQDLAQIERANKERDQIDVALEAKIKAEAREIANPLRAMMLEEAERRGIPIEDIMRELASQPTTT